MESFASNLKKRAVELGLSNADVARRAGLAERRYGNYITGRREPDLATLVRIATVLESSPNALLGFDQPGGKPGADELARSRIAAAARVLAGDDLEIMAVALQAAARYRSK